MSLLKIFTKRQIEEVKSIRAKHPLAQDIFSKMHLYKGVSEYESRLIELVDYFGYEKGAKAHFCRIYGGEAMPIREKLGLSLVEMMIMNMYASFNRMSPDRQDMYYIFDYIVKKAEATFGKRENISVVDFGCGLGQIGIAFCLAGFPVYFVDVREEFLQFTEFLCSKRKIKNYKIVQHNDLRTYPSMDIFNQPVRVIIEWSSFEHFYNPLTAFTWVKDLLVPKGLFVSTTAVLNWTDQFKEEIILDAGERAYNILSSEEYTNLSKKYFAVESPTGSIAKLLIKKP